jgi:hypothetical protein
MNLDQKIARLINLSQTIRAQEPSPTTLCEEQAAVSMARISECVMDLFIEGMPVQVVEHSLFYFWIRLEGSLRDVSEEQLDQLCLTEAVEQIITVVKTVVDNLPDYSATLEMQNLGKEINDLKSYISDRTLDHLSENELVSVVKNVNTRIYTVSSSLLIQFVHPEIIANVLFGYWLRTSTLQAHVSEAYYQKMEVYFCEIIAAARQQVPIIFSTKTAPG